MNPLNLKAGDWIEVKSKEEILLTLDRDGRLDGLPFMPQMFKSCGKRFRTLKRAHKTCDTVNDYKGRKMHAAVHLDGLRCDGEAYGGCQALCLIFWKEAWLRRIPNDSGAAAEPGSAAPTCTEADVLAATRSETAGEEPTFVCQATRLPEATEPLPWWDARQYLEDLWSGNVGVWRMTRGFVYMAYNGLINSGIGVGPTLRWLYDRLQRLWGGVPYPRRHGLVAAGSQTPSPKLDLQPGEWVRVKSLPRILETLDGSNKNRGLFFDAEMVPFCGRTYRVLSRVSVIVNEKTGKLQEFKSPCVILEGAACEARYSECRLFCPRAIFCYWRECWLERVAPEPSKASGPRP